MPVPTGEPWDVGERCAAALSNHQVRMIAMDGRSARGCSLPRAARSPPEGPPRRLVTGRLQFHLEFDSKATRR